MIRILTLDNHVFEGGDEMEVATLLWHDSRTHAPTLQAYMRDHARRVRVLKPRVHIRTETPALFLADLIREGFILPLKGF